MQKAKVKQGGETSPLASLCGTECGVWVYTHAKVRETPQGPALESGHLPGSDRRRQLCSSTQRHVRNRVELGHLLPLNLHSITDKLHSQRVSGNQVTMRPHPSRLTPHNTLGPREGGAWPCSKPALTSEAMPSQPTRVVSQQCYNRKLT